MRVEMGSFMQGREGKQEESSRFLKKAAQKFLLN
jgi:hypothetical protein